MRVGPACADVLGKLRVAHSEHTEDEAPVKLVIQLAARFQQNSRRSSSLASLVCPEGTMLDERIHS